MEFATSRLPTVFTRTEACNPTPAGLGCLNAARIRRGVSRRRTCPLERSRALMGGSDGEGCFHDAMLQAHRVDLRLDDHLRDRPAQPK